MADNPRLLSAAEFPRESEEEGRAAASRSLGILRAEQQHGADVSAEIKHVEPKAAPDVPAAKLVPVDQKTGDVAPIKIPKWSDIAASPKFQALDEAGRESVRLDYWKNYVSTQFDTDQIERARADFDEITKPTVVQRLKKAFTSKDVAEARDPFEGPSNMPGDEAPGAQTADGEFMKGTRAGVAGAKQITAAAALVPVLGGIANYSKQLEGYDAIEAGQLVTPPPGSKYTGAAHADPFMADLLRYQNITNPEQRKEMREASLQRIAGLRETQAALVDTWAAYSREAEQNKGKVPDFTDIEDVEGFTDWLAFNIGQGIPYIGASAMAGVLGAVLGGPAGAALGLGASGLAMGAGDITSEMLERRHAPAVDIHSQQPEVDVKAAAAGAVPYAALEFLGPTGRAVRIAYRGSQEALEQVAEGYLKRAGKEGVKNAIEEFLNEAGQEIVKDATVAEGGERVLTEANLKKWFNSGMAGAAAGAPFGAATAAMEKQPKPTAEQQQERALPADQVLGTEENEETPPPAAEPQPAQPKAPPAKKPKKEAAGEAPSKPAPPAEQRGEAEPPPPRSSRREAPEDGAGANVESEPRAAGQAPGATGTDKKPTEPAAAASPADDLEGAAKGLKGIFESPVDEAAHQAATSPHNDKPQPTKPQIEANNAPLGHPRVAGMEISTENPAGSVRRDIKNDPPRWQVEMKGAHYGYFRNTIGYDKDHLDVFVKEGTPEDWTGTVFVINQNKAGNFHFDEHKVVLGVSSEQEAREIYLGNFDDRERAEKLIRSIVPLELEPFKAWAYNKTEKGPRGGELGTEEVEQFNRRAAARREYEQERAFVKALPDEAKEAFRALADAQRGEPESAMLRVQKAMGGGVLNPVVEHVGDLTHRMTNDVKYGESGFEFVREKLDKTIRQLDHPYGFEREMRENIVANAKVRGISVDEATAKVNAALDRYAQAHRALPVYNEVQRIARDAAVAVGERRFRDASALLHELDKKAQSRWQFAQEAAKFELQEKPHAIPKQGADEGSVRRPPRTGDEGQGPAVGARDAEPEKPAGEKAPAPEQKPADALSGEEVKKLSEQFGTLLRSHTGFGRSINEARAYAAERLKRPVKPGTMAAKQVDEALELGVVLAARDIVRSMREKGRTDKEIYLALRELYGRQPNLNVRTSTSVAQQAYSTPVPLAFIASRLAGITSKSRVLEPTAGNGMLLIEAGHDNAVANELNRDRADSLRSQGFIPTQVDATELPTMEPVDAVIANPPFGYVKDDSGGKFLNKRWQITDDYTTNQIDHAIAMKSLEAMKDDGRAVLIVAAPDKLKTGESRHDAYNGRALRSFYYTLYGAYNVVDHFTVSGDLYAKQGAAWPVDVIVIRGRGKSARTLPAADLPKLYSSWDALTEKLDARYAEGSASDRRQGEGASAPAAGDRAERGDGERGGPVRDGGTPASASERAGPGPVRGGRDRGQPAPAGLAAGEGDQRGGPAGRGDVRRPDRPANAEGDRTDVGKIFDEEFNTLFGDIEKAPRRGAGTTPQASAVVPPSGETPGAADLAASAARETVSGLDEAAKGLTELFGGKGKLGSGPTFDEETYAKAKPHFIAGVQHFKAAAKDVREMVRLLLQALREKYAMTLEAIQRMKPYVVRFVEDVTSGSIQLANWVRRKDAETELQVHYEPTSKVSSVGTLVPVNMATSTKESLAALEERVGDLDAYIAKELGYPAQKVGDYFSAEQVDALALAIDSMGRGAGFIIGDQTGVGKGRVVAGIIRWAQRNGKTPIFVTEKPNLYKDIYRDLVDIDMADVNPFMTNAGESIPLTEDGSVVLKTKAGPNHRNEMQKLIHQGHLDDHDVIFTTYSQMQTVKEKRTVRMDFLETFARGGVIIFDESHNAGGDADQKPKDARGEDENALNRAKFARAIAATAGGVFYSSATYAKRPEVMDLYFKTDMRLAVNSIAELPSAIRAGGVPLQQVVASMLAKAGQYIRRERSFAGLTYETRVATVNRDVAETMSRVMRDVASFDEAKGRAIEALKKQVRAEAKTITQDGSIGEAGVHSTNFTSIMHNMIDQMLLALKVIPAADLAVEAIKRGEKPVLTVANTMGSFIEHYVEDHHVKPGDSVGITFRDLMLRYLERSRDVVIGKPYGAKERHRLTDEQLGPTAAQLYKDIKERIEEATLLTEIPISPIDYLRDRIIKAGYKFGEITGRSHIIDYGTETPTYRIRPGKELSIRGRNDTISRFNRGELDSLLINQAGATGLSLHASEKFKDQRRRHMMIIQPERNIDTHMQMLGRVHRTGQVITPTYTQLVADIPAEKRPAAVLAKKMASLNANTTASRGSAVTAKDVVDFMNEYGDEVAAQIMEDHPEWFKMMGEPLKYDEDGNGYKREDAIRKVTGRIPLLPLKQQEQLYDLIESEYKALVEEKDRLGENALEAKTLELEAKTLKTFEVVASAGGTSPFSSGVNAEIVDVKKLGGAFQPEEVLDLLREQLGMGDDVGLDALAAEGRRRAARTRQEVETDFRAYVKDELDLIDPKKREGTSTRLNGMHARLDSLLAYATVGAMLSLKTKFGVVPAVVTEVENTQETDNPAALGAWKFTFAVADSVRHVTIPASRLYVASKAPTDADKMDLALLSDYVPSKELEGKPPLDAFKEALSVSREQRTIITGNLLASFAKFARGRIINYTTSTGEIRQGILMPAWFDIDRAVNDMPVEFPNGRAAVGFLAEMEKKKNPAVVESVDEKVYRVAKIWGQDSYRISVAAAKEKGGRIYLDKDVLAAAGQDFVKAAASMRVELPADQAAAVLDAIFALGYKAHTSSNRQEAKDFLAAQGVTTLNAPPPTGWDKIDTAIELQPLVDRVDADEKKRVSALQTLRRLEEKHAAGKITDAEFVASARDLLAELEARNDAKQLQDFVTPRVRGADYIRERLIRARRQGELGPAETDFALWLLDQAPQTAHGLGFSISRKGAGRAGDYEVYHRVARVFSHIATGGTTVHEILHHTERMMPAAVQAGIRREWVRQFMAQMVASRENDPIAFKLFSDLLHQHLGYGTQELEDRINIGLQQRPHLYQYVNASEFWAVNATRIMEGRYGAKSWIAKAKQWLGELIEKLKIVFRLPSDRAVLRGLDAVMRGDGSFQSPDMLVNAKEYANAAPAARPARDGAASMERDMGLTDKVLSAPFKLARWDQLVSRAGAIVHDLNERATEAFPVYEAVRAGVQDRYGLEEAYKDRRVEMQVNLQKWARGAVTMLDKIMTLSREESRVAYEWMNERDADTLIEGLPPESQQTLRELKELIRSLGEEGVRLGQLSQEVFERNELAYLHRSYYRHELEATLSDKIGRRKNIAVWGEQYRGRGLKDWRTHADLQQLAEEQLDPMKVKGRKFHRLELRAAVRESATGDLSRLGGRERLGRLRKVVYWPEGKPIPQKYAAWRNDGLWEVRWFHGGKWGLWRDLNGEEREALGEIDEVRYAVAKTLHLMTHDIEVGRMQEWVAQNYAKTSADPGDRVVTAREAEGMDWLAVYRRNVWVKVPDSKVEGTNTLRYGALAGMMVPGPVWNDIRQHVSVGRKGNGFTRLWDDTMRMWKMSKTALSPGVHTNNIMANMFIADFHDLRAKDLVKALRVMLDVKFSKQPNADNADLYRHFEDSGALHGMFKYHELKAELLDPLLEQIRTEAIGDEQLAMTRVLSVISMLNGLERAGKAAKKFTVDAMTEAYSAEDEVFRLAMFIKARRHGLSDLEAGKLARAAFLDYDINAPWIQALRRTAFPFIAFPYRAIPMMVDTFINKPWKPIKYMAWAYVLNALAYAMLGLGDGDEERERKLLPEEKSGKIWGMFHKMMRMPWNSDQDQPVFLDVRRWFPAGDVFDVGGTHAALPWSPTALPGGPMALLAELFANKSQFTGQDITLDTDTLTEKLGKTGLHLYRFAAPNLFMIPGTWSFEGLRQASGLGEAGRQTDVFGREMSLPQAFGSALGVKLGTYPEDVMRYNLVRKNNAEQREIMGNIYKMLGERQRNKISDAQLREGVKDQTDKLKRLQEELREKMRPAAPR